MKRLAKGPVRTVPQAGLEPACICIRIKATNHETTTCPSFLVQTSSCGGADHEDDPCDLGVIEEEAKIDEVSFCMRIFRHSERLPSLDNVRNCADQSLSH